MTDDPPQPPNEHQKWLHELNRQDAQRAQDNHAEHFQKVNSATIAGANLALKMALLINGGACLSLLTFVGSLPLNQRPAVADALTWFAIGVSLASFDFMLAYLTHYATAATIHSWIPISEFPYFQMGPATKRWHWAKIILHIAAVIIAIASLAIFVVGVLDVRYALIHLG